MKFKLTTTKVSKTETEVEANFPCCTKVGKYRKYYCKDEKTVICVEDYGNMELDGINGSIIGMAFSDGWEFSTKEEFEESYNRVLNNFNQTIK